MKIRFIEYNGDMYVVVGFAYEVRFDPPECYVAVPLRDTVMRSVLLGLDTITIPFCDAVEVSDINRVKALLVLYGK